MTLDSRFRKPLVTVGAFSEDPRTKTLLSSSLEARVSLSSAFAPCAQSFATYGVASLFGFQAIAATNGIIRY